MRDLLKTQLEQSQLQPGFVPAICQLLSAISIADGPVTLNEYRLIIDVAEKLAKQSDNPALIKIYALQGILDPISLESTLKVLKKYAQDYRYEHRLSIFETLLPLIRLQLQASDIESRIFTYLCLHENRFNQLFHSSHIPQYLSQFKHSLLPASQNLTALERIKSFALRYHQQDLLDCLESFEHQSEAGLSRLSVRLEQASNAILQAIETFQIQLDELNHQERLAQQLSELAKTLYEQVQQRLQSIEDRAELQKQFFHEDINDFITKSVNDLELNLRQLLEVEDWANPQVWNDFAESEAATSLLTHYKKLQNRYGQIFNQWEQEFQTFSKELVKTRTIILQRLEQQDLSRLIKPPSIKLRTLNRLDKVSDLVMNTLKVTTTGTLSIGGIALATGIPASLFIVGTTAIGSFVIANPLGWTIIGTVTLAGIYRFFSRPGKRKNDEISDKRQVIEEGLKQLLGQPEINHNQHLDEIVTNFQQSAQENFTPLLQDTNLLVELNKMQSKVLRHIAETTRREINSLNSADPAAVYIV
jgi:hypothetical protein